MHYAGITGAGTALGAGARAAPPRRKDFRRESDFEAATKQYRDHASAPPVKGDDLKHYGVKGMKWGVRKKYDRPYSLEEIKKNYGDDFF